MSMTANENVATASNVLVVEADPVLRDRVAGLLRHGHYGVTLVADASEALSALRNGALTAVVADLDLRGGPGLELFARVAELQPDLPVIALTGSAAPDTALAAIRAGAYDSVSKPIDSESLLIALERAVDHRRLVDEVRRLRQVVQGSAPPPGMIGDSLVMRQVYELITQVAPGDATVLVTGESGTGKELVARAIHARSPRHAQPFVALDCAAIASTLIESELFGHERGAFTDADRAHVGRFVQADRGTLFLDEIGGVPLEVQAKLLRALQERTVRPLGGDAEVPFDVRLICSTHRDLEGAVADGSFRADLFYRINVVHVHVPALRERRDDIPLLAQAIVERFAARVEPPPTGFSGPALRKLVDYDWPGNVRELENCVERAVTLGRGGEIMIDQLPETIREHVGTRTEPPGDDPTTLMPLAELEQRYIRRVLAAVHGNKTHAARILGLDRRSLYRRLEKVEH